MKSALAAMSLAAVGIGGCSADQSETASEPVRLSDTNHDPIDVRLVNALVDSYDVPSCVGARLRYAGRKNVGEVVFHERHFDASDQCMRDLIQSAERLGFTQDRIGEWSGEIIDGTVEKLSLLSDADQMPGNLVWEIDVT